MLSSSILQSLETEISRIYADIETELVTRISEELAKGVSASASPILWRMEKLRQMGRLSGKLTTVLRQQSGRISSQLDDAIMEAMTKAAGSDDTVLMQIKAVKEKIAAGTFVDAVKSSVFEKYAEAAIANARTALNLTNTAALQAGLSSWSSAVNSAYLKTLTGTTSLNDAVRQAVRSLGGSGLTVTYQSAKGTLTSYSLDAAVRRDVVTSVNQSAAQMTVSRCGDYDCDLVEVTSHAGARPEHQIWQGKVYSLNGKTPGYQLLSVATGYGTASGLCGVNCRHSFYPYFPGLSKQTDQSDMPGKTENADIYKATQQQRYYERQIRIAKLQKAACGSIGDSEGVDTASARIASYQSKMRSLVSSSNLTRQYAREQIVT